MTNEELKKKIAQIINDGIIHGEDNFGMPTSKTIENIADALIAAGIVDKSDYASMKETAVRYKAEVSKAGARAKEAEHRAEVAERALRDKATYSAMEDMDYFSLPSVAIEARAKELYKSWRRQAEKELAEDGKDD